MSLYTKYRPKDWDSVVGQNFIVKILRSSLKNGNTGHAYILTGSRGTGKTTSARILAKSFNCLDLQDGNPCNACENCQAFENGTMIDIIEIDGASNALVDDIRAMIDEAKFLPTFGKFKVYIIDEVHMLGKSAFNALLKTLEEPPEHVKFILATTEIDKVPETIRSRAQRFDFQKISEKNIADRLNFVIDAEKITADPGAIELIAKLSRGGMRDALTLLEQFSVDKNLSLEFLQNTFSMIDDDFMDEIIEILASKNHEKFAEMIEKIKTQHIRSENFFEQIILRLRDKMVENLGNEKFGLYNSIFEIFRKSYPSIGYFSDNFLVIEMTLMQAINAENFPQNAVPNTDKKPQFTAPKKIVEPKIKPETLTEPKEISKPITDSAPTKIVPKLEEKIEKKTEIISENIEPKAEKIPETPKTAEFSFRRLLTEMKDTDPVVLATIKNASFKQDGETLELSFGNKWTADKMQETRYQSPVIAVLNKIF